MPSEQLELPSKEMLLLDVGGDSAVSKDLPLSMVQTAVVSVAWTWYDDRQATNLTDLIA